MSIIVGKKITKKFGTLRAVVVYTAVLFLQIKRLKIIPNLFNLLFHE